MNHTNLILFPYPTLKEIASQSILSLKAASSFKGEVLVDFKKSSPNTLVGYGIFSLLKKNML